MEIQNAENFKCPECGEPFTEEKMMDACGEPFNGTIIMCSECNKEWSVDINFVINRLG